MLSAEHDIHVSVCEIDIEDNGAEIVLKTFLDDLQIALDLEPGEDLPVNYTSAEELILEYVREQVVLRISGQKLDLILDDISSSGDAIWLSLKCILPEGVDHADFELFNGLLTEVYDDQTNLVNLHLPEGQKSFIMDRKKKLIKTNF